MHLMPLHMASLPAMLMLLLSLRSKSPVSWKALSRASHAMLSFVLFPQLLTPGCRRPVGVKNPVNDTTAKTGLGN